MKLNFWKVLGAIVALMVVVNGASAQQAVKMTDDELKVKQKLEQKIPGAPIDRVIKTSLLGGLYEVVVEGQLIYTNSEVTHLIAGQILDISRSPQERVNVTEQRMKELFNVDVASLPLEASFKRVKGDGSRVLYLFSDLDCPYCAVLEKTLSEMTNLTIYTFMYPLEELHPSAVSKSKKIWCAPDRAKAWEAYFASKELPKNAGDCKVPIETVQNLAKRYNIRGTPGLVFADGQVIPGALPKDQLEQMLQATAAAAAEKSKKK
ncbi:MAG: DsbC family protein [Burkholderiales bacterium]|nr:DsbC family protein [Burkholderiales bacterium]